ncbi:ammonia monooxygenase [Rhodovastum atsumiense]|uniref:Ammonia monooxygenase n=1 Tax=Rhodovastum atsumiense TaxID=504468 RepID=A0A5M6IQ63_9PROT|nr:ammonia monooxygenase [Rhodovastum atsumiense]
MSAKLRELSSQHGRMLGFWCPGCQETHAVTVDGPNANGARWSWDGNADAPTFSPSVLVTSGHYVSSHKPGDSCWCNYEARLGRKAPFLCHRCHSFVRAGRIEFLSDCTHSLAGRTVDLPDWPAAEDVE